jgi:hypothetical protein
VSVYSSAQIESVLVGSSANLYESVKDLYLSFEDGINNKIIRNFYNIAIKQNILLSVLSDNLSSDDVKQTIVSELNAMGVTDSETSFYLSPGYTNKDYVF